MNTLEPLTALECWELLRQHTVGRIAFTDRALPAIVPVNYTLIGNRIMLRCRADGLASKLDGQIVAFEVDDVDHQHRGGWSVVVTGTATRLARPGDLARTTALPRSWAGPDHQTAVRITVGDIQGRRLHGVA